MNVHNLEQTTETDIDIDHLPEATAHTLDIMTTEITTDKACPDHIRATTTTEATADITPGEDNPDLTVDPTTDLHPVTDPLTHATPDAIHLTGDHHRTEVFRENTDKADHFNLPQHIHPENKDATNIIQKINRQPVSKLSSTIHILSITVPTKQKAIQRTI